MATVPLAARFIGGREVALRLHDAAMSAEGEARDAVEEAAEQSVFVFRAVAPRKTGRLARGIRAVVRGSSAEVVSRARSRTGYRYTAVTRFGHRVRVITPTSAKVLRFTIGRRVLFRASVKGFRPRRDWAARGVAPAERLVEAAGKRAGERIVARVAS